MRHGLYGIFWTLPATTDFDHYCGGKHMWMMAREKRFALRLARGYRAVVTRMDLPSSVCWDAPTFRACSDVIADYRKEKR